MTNNRIQRKLINYSSCDTKWIKDFLEESCLDLLNLSSILSQDMKEKSEST